MRAERDAMALASNPWVVNLHFSFQDDDNLYLVCQHKLLCLIEHFRDKNKVSFD